MLLILLQAAYESLIYFNLTARSRNYLYAIITRTCT